ncbi:MAG: nitroreductase family protein [Phycisphaerae bacterium]
MPAPTIPFSLPFQDASAQRESLDALIARMKTRRTVRHFSDKPVARDVIERILEVAHSAPSGANRKPWRFVAVDDPAMKRDIRLAAEKEERENYDHRFPQEWLDALEPFGTDASKPFLEIAPWVIVVFRVDWEMHEGEKRKNYYPIESTGLAAGMLITACHFAGLATLTHTPNPMNFLRDICGRPQNEKPYLLMPVGYPADDARVPDLQKLPLAARVQWNREENADAV